MADIQNVDPRQDASPVEVVGRIKDAVTGEQKIVPLRLTQALDGTWALDISATVEGDVIIGGAMALKNVAGATINPSTLEAQVTTNTLLNSLASTMATGTLNVISAVGSKVQLTDGTDDNLITASGQVLTSPGRLSGEDIADDSIAVNMNKITPNIYNVVCTATATIYSQALPAFCKGFDVKLRETSGSLKISFNSGLSTYFTIPANSAYNVESCSLVTATLYFQSDTNSVHAEIIAWS